MYQDNELSARITVSVPGLTMEHYPKFRDELRKLLPDMVQLATFRALGLKPGEVTDPDVLKTQLEKTLPAAVELAQLRIDRKQP